MDGVGGFSGANGDKDHRDIGPKRFTFYVGCVTRKEW